MKRPTQSIGRSDFRAGSRGWVGNRTEAPIEPGTGPYHIAADPLPKAECGSNSMAGPIPAGWNNRISPRNYEVVRELLGLRR